MSRLHSLAFSALAIIATPAVAAVHLVCMVNGSPVNVAWPRSAFPVRYAVDSRVNAAFPKGVIERAFGDWTAVEDARITFQSDGVVNGAKPGKDGQNTITFVDDLFQDQNFLAVTTNWYDDTGHMAEADIQIDPSVVPGGYNLELLVEHEIGHLLGLDHSGVLSSVMYPYVGRGGPALLDHDDQSEVDRLVCARNQRRITRLHVGGRRVRKKRQYRCRRRWIRQRHDDVRDPQSELPPRFGFSICRQLRLRHVQCCPRRRCRVDGRSRQERQRVRCPDRRPSGHRTRPRARRPTLTYTSRRIF